jgi:hypothetical protein
LKEKTRTFSAFDLMSGLVMAGL